jgi:hypothetical protein
VDEALRNTGATPAPALVAWIDRRPLPSVTVPPRSWHVFFGALVPMLVVAALTLGVALGGSGTRQRAVRGSQFVLALGFELFILLPFFEWRWRVTESETFHGFDMSLWFLPWVPALLAFVALAPAVSIALAFSPGRARWPRVAIALVAAAAVALTLAHALDESPTSWLTSQVPYALTLPTLILSPIASSILGWRSGGAALAGGRDGTREAIGAAMQTFGTEIALAALLAVSGALLAAVYLVTRSAVDDPLGWHLLFGGLTPLLVLAALTLGIALGGGTWQRATRGTLFVLALGFELIVIAPAFQFLTTPGGVTWSPYILFMPWLPAGLALVALGPALSIALAFSPGKARWLRVAIALVAAAALALIVAHALDVIEGFGLESLRWERLLRYVEKDSWLTSRVPYAVTLPVLLVCPLASYVVGRLFGNARAPAAPSAALSR